MSCETVKINEFVPCQFVYTDSKGRARGTFELVSLSLCVEGGECELRYQWRCTQTFEKDGRVRTHDAATVATHFASTGFCLPLGTRGAMAAIYADLESMETNNPIEAVALREFARIVDKRWDVRALYLASGWEW